METLKEIRIRRGLRQSDIADRIQRLPYEVSNYESGAALPDMEDALIIEKTLSEKILWREPLQVKEKREAIQCLIALSERYPLEMVLDFGRRALKEGSKIGDPVCLIRHYAKVAGVMHDVEPPMMPPGLCTDCE